MTNLKKAPQRNVERVWKSGRYGNVTWFHELSCGHVEPRKRKAPAPKMACPQCLEGSPARSEAEAVDPVVQMTLVEERTKRVISEKLEVPQDSIQVIFGFSGTAVQAVRITLSQEEVQEILER